MTPSVTLVRVFDRSWEAWLHGVDACRRKASRRRVHALRVDCRRLEALITVLGHTTDAPPHALRRLRKIAVQPLAALSKLRDDQVQRRRVDEAAAGSALEALRDDVDRHRDRHKKRAQRALGEIDLSNADATASRIRHAVVRRQGAPTPDQRAQLLTAAAASAAAEFATRMAQADPARPRTLHRLRVAAKRVRYVAEIAAEIAPHVPVGALPQLRALQRDLGRVHDTELLAARIDRIAARRKTPNKKALRAFKAQLLAGRARTLRELSRALPLLRANARRTAR